MGCCISKCRPDKHSLGLGSHLQDKLVVLSQAPPTPTSNKISPSPPSPTSSISSFTCTTNSNTLSSASSFSSTSSSSSSSYKDRSFSNEFLWSCYKENPHISRINSLTETTTTLSFIPTKPKPQSSKVVVNPSLTNLSPHQNVVVAGKRVRSNSPANLTRQKSFRKEPSLRPINSASSRTLQSPSPSRRFSASPLATTMISDNSVSKRTVNNIPKVSVTPHYSRSVSNVVKAVAMSPNNSSRRLHSGLKHSRDTCNFGVGSKIDETVVKDVLLPSAHDMDSTMMMEDIDNPLISFDCFIFL